jgi:uncharacterized alkaline shock family protein YloU
MYIDAENRYGIIRMSKNMIAKIAAFAAMDCYGLVGMARKHYGLVELLKREHGSKGVRIKQDDDGIIIDLFVIFEFGVKLQTVAENVVEKVRYNVELATDVKVKKINIYIESVRI